MNGERGALDLGARVAGPAARVWPLVVGVGMVSFALLSCKASVSAKAEMNATGSQDVVSTEESMDESGSKDMALAPSRTGAAPEGETALFGARHDLRLAESVQSGDCQCLAVAVGSPQDKAFSWQSDPPIIDPRSQLIIALSSDGVACSNEPEGSLGASYWGYRTSGGDVIVVVEAAKFGRPVTTGAIVPKPTSGGRLLVKPLDKTVPYGAALDGSNSGCAVFEG